MTRSWRHVLCIDIDCNYFMQFGYFRSVSIGTVCGEGKELLFRRLVGTYQGLWLLKNSLSLRFLNWGTRIFPEFNIFCHMPCHALHYLSLWCGETEGVFYLLTIDIPPPRASIRYSFFFFSSQYAPIQQTCGREIKENCKVFAF